MASSVTEQAQQSIEMPEQESGCDAIGQQTGTMTASGMEQAQQSIEATEDSGVDSIGQQTASIESSRTNKISPPPPEACTTEQVQESIEESVQEAGLDDNAQPGLWDAGSAMDPASPAPLFRPSEQFLARAAEERARGARGPAEGAHAID